MRKNFQINHFFDTFQEFYSTSKTGSFPNRLNNRYLALIESNKEIIKNSSILDIGSHDGRWSFAALKNNASKVIGVEPRESLVKNSQRNMKFYGIPKEKYNFIKGDIFQEIKKIKPRTIDVVFCFGFFYHIMNHMLLLSEIKKLEPKYLILDTGVHLSENPVIQLHEEDPTDESMGKQNQLLSSLNILVGLPSKRAVELMLEAAGFDYQYYNWHNKGIKNWDHILDYQTNKRFSLVAKTITKDNILTQEELLLTQSKTINNLKQTIEAQHNSIMNLKQTIELIQNSFTWRTLTKIDKFRKKF